MAPTEEEEALAAGAAAAAAGAGEGLGLFDCFGPGPPRNLGEEDLAPFAAGGVASRAAVTGGSRPGMGVRLGELAGGVAGLAWGWGGVLGRLAGWASPLWGGGPRERWR